MENLEEQIICFLCESASINQENNVHHEYQSHKICNSCMRTLQENNVIANQANLSPSDCVIPPETDEINGQLEICNNHGVKCKLFCSKCIVSICINCLGHHRFHLIETITEVAKSLIKSLHQIEFCARFIELNSRDENENRESRLIKDAVIQIYNDIKYKNANHIAKELPKIINEKEELLNELNPDFLGLNVNEKYKLIREGRELFKNTSIMHWIE